MTRLLNANFARLFKGKLFWICAGAAVILGAMEIIPHHSEMELITPETFLFNASGFFLPIITAIFVGIFVGDEHSEVLRNKIIVGHKRLAIYLSDLIVCLISVVIVHILYFGSILVTGVMFGGKIEVSAGVIAVYELLQLVSLLGICALFTAIAMLVPKRFVGAIASLVLVIGLYFINILMNDRLRILDDKYYIESLEITDAELAEREFLYVAQDFLLFGQNEQIGRCFNSEVRKFDSPEPIPTEIAFYSLGTIAVTTAVGAIAFRKIDIK
ncbi:MAG: ABC transporter permease subunit [Oscillospiraceae bacterium]